MNILIRRLQIKSKQIIFILDLYEKNLKLGYQTLTDTCPDQSYSLDSQCNQASHEKSEIPDSMALQFENRIDDFLIVPETPPEKTPLSERKQKTANNDSNVDTQVSPYMEDVVQKNTKINKQIPPPPPHIDAVMDCDDSFDFESQKTIAPVEVKKRLDYELTRKENVQSPKTKKVKVQTVVHTVTIDSQENSNPKNKSSIKLSMQKQKSQIKSEKVERKDDTFMRAYKKLDVDIVYCKNLPPAHSIKPKLEVRNILMNALI